MKKEVSRAAGRRLRLLHSIILIIIMYPGASTDSASAPLLRAAQQPAYQAINPVVPPPPSGRSLSSSLRIFHSHLQLSLLGLFALPQIFRLHGIFLAFFLILLGVFYQILSRHLFFFISSLFPNSSFSYGISSFSSSQRIFLFLGIFLLLGKILFSLILLWKIISTIFPAFFLLFSLSSGPEDFSIYSHYLFLGLIFLFPSFLGLGGLGFSIFSTSGRKKLHLFQTLLFFSLFVFLLMIIESLAFSSSSFLEGPRKSLDFPINSPLFPSLDELSLFSLNRNIFFSLGIILYCFSRGDFLWNEWKENEENEAREGEIERIPGNSMISSRFQRFSRRVLYSAIFQGISYFLLAMGFYLIFGSFVKENLLGNCLKTSITGENIAFFLPKEEFPIENGYFLIWESILGIFLILSIPLQFLPLISTVSPLLQSLFPHSSLSSSPFLFYSLGLFFYCFSYFLSMVNISYSSWVSLMGISFSLPLYGIFPLLLVLGIFEEEIPEFIEISRSLEREIKNLPLYRAFLLILVILLSFYAILGNFVVQQDIRTGKTPQ